MFLRLILLKLPRQCTDGNGYIERYGETQLTLDKTGAFKQTLLNKALDLLLLSHMVFLAMQIYNSKLLGSIFYNMYRKWFIVFLLE